MSEKKQTYDPTTGDGSAVAAAIQAGQRDGILILMVKANQRVAVVLEGDPTTERSRLLLEQSWQQASRALVRPVNPRDKKAVEAALQEGVADGGA